MAYRLRARRLVQPDPHVDVLLPLREDVRIETEECAANLRCDVRHREAQARGARLEIDLQLALTEAVVVEDVRDALELPQLLLDLGHRGLLRDLVLSEYLDRDVRTSRTTGDLAVGNALEILDRAHLLADRGHDLRGRSVALLDRLELDEDLRQVRGRRLHHARIQIALLSDDRAQPFALRLIANGLFQTADHFAGSLD